MRPNQGIRAGAGFLAALTLGVALAPPHAYAISDLTKRFQGLYVRDDGANGILLGEVYARTDWASVNRNYFGRRANDAYGDRIGVVAHVRDALITNQNGVYVDARQYNNGTYCYLSGISISFGDKGAGGGVSTSCASNQWHRDGQQRGWAAGTGGWTYVNKNYGKEGPMASQGFDVWVCEDEISFLPDICSVGGRFVGIDWN